MRSEFWFLVLVLTLFTMPGVLSQNCGDYLCDAGETFENCPDDCGGGDIAGKDDTALLENDTPANEVIVSADNVTLPIDAALAGDIQDKASESSEEGYIIKIVVITLLLAILGIIIFFIYSKMKKDGSALGSNETSEGNPTQQV